MKILKVKKTPQYDVFTGEGWENWVRVKVLPNGTIEVVGGSCYPDVLRKVQRFINEERTKK